MIKQNRLTPRLFLTFILNLNILDFIINYFSHIPADWREFISEPGRFLPIIGMLIVLESLLSIDNAAVLATMVRDLPKEERGKALKYGIIGAYLFRGICLILANLLIQVWWLKPIGGLYLIYLTIDFFRKQTNANKEDNIEEVLEELEHELAELEDEKIPQEEIIETQQEKKKSWIYNITIGVIGNFWATVLMIEIMDLAFSLDNVFAAVAFTKNIFPIWIGVFIGILAMRYVAQAFVKLMERFPFLETAAFTVIGLLGIKLFLALITHFMPNSSFTEMLESETTDAIVSLLTILIFAVPIATSYLFGIPKRHK